MFFYYQDVTVPRENVTSVLATLANVCHDMVENKKFSKEDFTMLSLRAMVGSIILYDHVSEQGAFVKKSPINVCASFPSSSLSFSSFLFPIPAIAINTIILD